MFENNPDVVFGDVTLSDAPGLRRDFSPGKGGWPTIMYFNKEHPKGQHYTKKTDEAMCTELGPSGENFMEQYVLEAGNTFICSVETKLGCGEKEGKYIDKWKTKPQEKIKAQISRLTKMASKKMSADLEAWRKARLRILEQFQSNRAEVKKKEEL